MKLWLLSRDDDVDCDEYAAFVMRAETAEQARYMASQQAADEGVTPWLNTTLSTCVELTTDGEAGVVLSDFNAG